MSARLITLGFLLLEGILSHSQHVTAGAVDASNLGAWAPEVFPARFSVNLSRDAFHPRACQAGCQPIRCMRRRFMAAQINGHSA